VNATGIVKKDRRILRELEEGRDIGRKSTRAKTANNSM